MNIINSIPEQVRRRIKVTEGCWLWKGTIAKNGYGVVKIGGRKGKLKYIHRLVAKISFGDLPKGLFVCHTCDNRICCNPDHLFLGLPAENAADAASKKRIKGPRLIGETNPSAKLAETDIHKIRSLWQSGFGFQQIADQFGVSKNTIWNVVRRVSWRHI